MFAGTAMMSSCLGVGTSKLIVSVSFGSHASFKWKGKSCPDGEASWCCLGHGDILFVDGQCQDEFLHCTDTGLEQKRIHVTVPSGVVCCLATCAQGSSAAVTRVVGHGFSGILVFGVL